MNVLFVYGNFFEFSDYIVIENFLLVIFVFVI